VKKYWKYFRYVVEHKKNVFIECWKMGLYYQAFVHDLSKFLPSEFIPYARFFYETDREKNYKRSDESNMNFQMGWLHHQKRNKHHWNYWISISRMNDIRPMPMPKKYVLEMIADWKGMSRKFGGSAKEYYNKIKGEMILHPETVKLIEQYLEVN
jgi:hypothetical protein